MSKTKTKGKSAGIFCTLLGHEIIEILLSLIFIVEGMGGFLLFYTVL
jgi:hypothetical protein